MTIVDFTAGDLISVVREVAEKNPTFVYDVDSDGVNGSCVNFKDGAPSCIIGHGLYRLGMTETSMGTYAQSSEVLSVLDGFQIESTEKQSDWLSTVQNEQDLGYPWLDAVKLADRVVAENKESGFYDD
jgi:hypothetical protein